MDGAILEITIWVTSLPAQSMYSCYLSIGQRNLINYDLSNTILPELIFPASSSTDSFHYIDQPEQYWHLYQGTDC